MCWYASIGDTKSLKEFIELGVDLNLGDYDNRTALHLAAAENQLYTLSLLCFHKALLVKDNMGDSAFEDAIRADSL